MESNNNNKNNMFLCEFKELRKEISGMKKRIVQLEKSDEKKQERLDNLERENHALKTQLNINSNKEGESALKRKRIDQDTDEEMESKPASALASTGKKTKINNNSDDDEGTMLPRYNNGDSFDSLSDDLLHKIVEFDGNCYSKFGSINKRCKKIYDVKEYKLKKQTCFFGYGTVDMMLQHYLKERRYFSIFGDSIRFNHESSKIGQAVIWYNRLDAIDWIVQLGNRELLQRVCFIVISLGRVNILTKVFCKCNLTMLDKLLNDTKLCRIAAQHGQLETLKWLRRYGAKWDKFTFNYASICGHDEIVQYLRNEGCPGTQDEDSGDSSGSDEDSDY